MRKLFTLPLVLLLLCAVLCAQNRKIGRAAPGRMGLERLNRMAPEDRQRLLEKLPPERKSVVERRLDRYNKMPPESKERLRQDYEQFEQLPVDKQKRFRELYRSFNDLPEGRRGLVRNAYQRLRAMPPEKRKERLTSDQFRSRFSPSEQELLDNLTGLLTPAPQSAADR